MARKIAHTTQQDLVEDKGQHIGKAGSMFYSV